MKLARLFIVADQDEVELLTGGGGELGGRAHLVVALGFVATLAFILSLVRRRQLRGKYAMLWLAVGIGFAPLVIAPDLLTWSARRVGIYYEPTLLTFAVLGFLLLVAMHFSWELSRLEDRSRTLAEEVALLRSQLEEAGLRLPPVPSTSASDPGSPDELAVESVAPTTATTARTGEEPA